MTKTLAPRTSANPRTLLERILGQPDLVSAVQALPPAAVLRLIDRVGLEDAGELVALTTVDQLRRVFDEDLWRSGRPGEDERFDPARFTLWLEVMLEAGERFAADKLAELPEELVELALHHHILVISLEELALLISEGDGQVPLEKVVEDSPSLELGDYCIIGRSWEGWETLSTVLMALDERHGLRRGGVGPELPRAGAHQRRGEPACAAVAGCDHERLLPVQRGGAARRPRG
jgi:hypothetical protein